MKYRTRNLEQIFTLWFTGFLLLGLCNILLAQENKDCLMCHEDPELEDAYGNPMFIDLDEYDISIHGVNELKCVDCHADLHGFENYPHPKKMEDVDCGICHYKQILEFSSSVHRERFLEGNQDVPTCIDCHGKHDIQSPNNPLSDVYVTFVAQTCSNCHDDKSLAEKYGFTTQRMSSFLGSYHGFASRMGSKTVANCVSCHGYHEIRPSSDSLSTIHPSNIPATCGNCHTNAGENYAKGKVHVYNTKQDNIGVYFVNIFYIVLISTLMSGFLLFIASDLYRSKVLNNKKE